MLGRGRAPINMVMDFKKGQKKYSTGHRDLWSIKKYV